MFFFVVVFFTNVVPFNSDMRFGFLKSNFLDLLFGCEILILKEVNV